MRYTISEMASLLGVTTHTLRYYEKMGLIRPEVNEETGYRYYTVTDTRRFNLCRELRAAELSLEECRELIGSPSVEQSDEMFARQAARLRRRQVLDELSIRFLEKMQEQYRTLEQDAGRVWVQNFPEMWRLTFSQEEEASRDRELQQEKAEWLECMPPAPAGDGTVPGGAQRVRLRPDDGGRRCPQAGPAAHPACGGGMRRRLSCHHLEKRLPRLLRVGLTGNPAR